MTLSVYVIEAWRVGVPVSQLCLDHGLSRSWIYELISRYKEKGLAGLEPGSRRPLSNPNAYSREVVDVVLSERERLVSEGWDAGPESIRLNLLGQGLDAVPSRSTIWRWLKKAGLITPQPQKRPRSSYIRFEADLPNETWQSDMTHYKLDDGRGVEVLNTIDDHSRMIIHSRVFETVKGLNVIDCFADSFNKHGVPAGVLTDNGSIYTARFAGGVSGFERFCMEHNIKLKHGKPYKPTTQGKVERFHQTQKQWIAAQKSASSITELQVLLDEFTDKYNQQRIHRAHGTTPTIAWERRIKAHPINTEPKPFLRIRRHKIDNWGKTNLRQLGTKIQLMIGTKHKNKTITQLQKNNEIKTYDTQTKQHIATHQLTKNNTYQPNQKPD